MQLTEEHDAIRVASVRLRWVLGGLLAALWTRAAADHIDLSLILVAPLPFLIVAVAVIDDRIHDLVGPVVAAIAAVAAGVVCILVTFAVIEVDAGSSLVLLLALPLVDAAARLGVIGLTLAWFAASFAVLGWSLLQWNGMAMSVAEPILGLVILWAVPFTTASLSGHLSDRVSDFRAALAATERRAQLAGVVLEASGDLAVDSRDPALTLIEWTERLLGGRAVVFPVFDPAIEAHRDLSEQALTANGELVMRRLETGAASIAVSLGGPRSDVLVVECAVAPQNHELEVVELLALHVRTLRSSRPVSAERAASESVVPASPVPAPLVSQAPAPVAPVPAALLPVAIESSDAIPSLVEFLGASSNDFAELLLTGDVG